MIDVADYSHVPNGPGVLLVAHDAQFGYERNEVEVDDIVSLVLTATGDITSAFPAAGVRAAGLAGIPRMCARELEVAGSTPRCIRVLMHLYTGRPRTDLRHVYLHDAAALADDLPQ